jgi:hypothetical protein
MPWDTCFLVEGKGTGCGASNPPRPFKEFLGDGVWAKEPRDGFSAEFQWDLSQHEKGSVKALWREVGVLGSHRIRAVRYVFGEVAVADVVLAESNRGIFSPLMKWSGGMPPAAIHRVGAVEVLVVQKDAGGNVPMVSTWAWVWGPAGPLRLDVEGAAHAAIQRVAPGHTGYHTGLNWDTLHCVTWTWPEGRYPGKVGVGETVEAWFELEGTHLVVKRVQFRQGDEVRNWP